METIEHSHLGAKPDVADERDFAFVPVVTDLPVTTDLRIHCGQVYNQLPLKSCSAHAIASSLTFLGNKAGAPIAPPSRLFIYYNSRRIEGTQQSDDGATLRNAIKAITRDGACAESLWPYDATQFAVEPPQSCYANATVHAISYSRITQHMNDLKACLAEGFPFIFGMQAYQQPFVAAQTSGHIAMPAATDTLMGGHAVLAVGYDDVSQTVTVLNSLGPTWGAKGYFTMPYTYFADPELTYDFWTIRKID